MANKNLAEATLVSTCLTDDTVVIGVGSNIRRIKISDLRNVINSGDEMLLNQVAWGVPIKQNASSCAWGRIGNLGMWEEYKSKCGRFLVTNDGKAAKIHSSRSDIFADGTTLDETKGHVMYIGPKLYYVVKEDAASGVPYLWLSMLPIGGHFMGDCNNGDYICIGAYKGSMSGSALVSRSGVAPAGSKTISAFWAAAQVNGKNWGLTNYDHRRYMMMLNLSQYGNPNCQVNIGYGVGGSVNLDLWSLVTGLLTGATKSLGDKDGKIPITVSGTVNGNTITGTDCSRVNLMGIEDAWGWQWEMIQGGYFGSSDNSSQNGTEFFIYDGNRMPSDAELKTIPSGKYRQLTRLTTSGYVKTMAVGEYFDMIATALGGGSTSYWADYFYGNGTGQLLAWGGSASNGSGAGLGYVYSSNAFSTSSSYYGGRLAYFGPLTFMSGKQLMEVA